jgi:hypothetical protein
MLWCNDTLEKPCQPLYKSLRTIQTFDAIKLDKASLNTPGNTETGTIRQEVNICLKCK